MGLIKKYGLYILSCLLFLDSFLVVMDLAKFRIITIGILMPIMIIFFYKNAKRSKKSVTYKNVFISLYLAFLSDIVFLINNYSLEKPIESLVVLSFVFILLANINYAFLFWRIKPIKIKKCPEAFVSLLITIPAAFILFRVLKVVPLGFYMLPIILGMIIMIIVIAISVNLLGEKAKKSMVIEHFIPGILSLAISLALMLIFKFLIPDVDFLAAVITLTYGFGHLLIVNGFVKYLKA